MIDICQWRASIGVWFSHQIVRAHGSTKAKTSHSTTSVQNPRTIAVAISLLLLLALSGDVELNPGPKSGKLVLLTMYDLYKTCHALNYIVYIIIVENEIVSSIYKNCTQLEYIKFYCMIVS